MQVIERDPNKGYVDCSLWVPKSQINIEGTKAALTFAIADKRDMRILSLYQETTDHLVVPREFWDPTELPFEMVDCRPKTFPKVSIKSRIILDAKDPSKHIQRDAVAAMLAARGGVLQLACVAGDTILNLSRAGKGFKMPISKAYEHFQGKKYAWDRAIPTYTRAKLDRGFGLQLVTAIVLTGYRETWELELVDGRKLRLTEDHEVLTPSGFLSLQTGLAVGDEIITDGGQTKWGKKAESQRGTKVVYKRLNWYPSHPYAHKNGTKTGPQVGVRQTWTLEEHRAVAEAHLNGLTLESFRERCRSGNVVGLVFINPDEFHVHHKDHDHRNNNCDNLEVLTHEEHRARHPADSVDFGYGKPLPVRLKAVRRGVKEAVYDVMCADPHHNFVANGFTVHNCGLGKTVCFLELCARMGVPTLIIVDNTHLLGQWLEAINNFLEVEGGIGMIGNGKFDWKKGVVLSTYQTLAERASSFTQEIRQWFGLVGWDEAHHMAAPTWSVTSDLFYGKRIGLTATPERVDGSHVIYDFHLGRVIYKNLTQELVPSIYFLWTGLQIDTSDPKVKEKTCDVNGEMHTSMLSSYFGQWQPRLDMILGEVKKAEKQNRKVLVLSYSIDELVNMFCIWSGLPNLYTSVPYPTAADVGETVEPKELSDNDRVRLYERRSLIEATEQQHYRQSPEERRKTSSILHGLRLQAEEIRSRLQAHTVWKKCELEFRRRQLAFLRESLKKNTSNAGIMIGDIKPAERQKMLREKQIVFAIMKYGREGLDEPSLDTVFVCEPMSQKNSLQQLMGRVLRKKAGKKPPVVVFFEDDIGPMIGMCQNLRRHLREWPLEEGGPFHYELVGHPRKATRKTWISL